MTLKNMRLPTEQELRRSFEDDGMTEREIENALDNFEANHQDDAEEPERLPPQRWHYISGAVWASPSDAYDPAKHAVAVRGSQRNPNLPEQFTPTEKDANMRLCAAAPQMAWALRAIIFQVIQGKVLERDACITQAREALKEAGLL